MKKFLVFLYITIGTSLLPPFGGTEGGLSAQTRFIRFYEPFFPPYTRSESYGLAETSYGYMLSGLTRDTTNEGYVYSAYTLIGTDFEGIELWQKKYGDARFSFGDMREGRSHLVKKGEYYYSVGKVYNTGEKTFSVIFKFNEQGDTIWMRQYRSADPGNIKMIMKSIYPLPGGELMVTGYEDNGIKFRGFLLKLDTMGNVIWKKSLPDLISGTIYAMVYDSVRDKYIVQKSAATESYIYIYIYIYI